MDSIVCSIRRRPYPVGSQDRSRNSDRLHSDRSPTIFPVPPGDSSVTRQHTPATDSGIGLPLVVPPSVTMTSTRLPSFAGRDDPLAIGIHGHGVGFDRSIGGRAGGSMPALDGKVALVTGASRGIGRAIAVRLG